MLERNHTVMIYNMYINNEVKMRCKSEDIKDLKENIKETKTILLTQFYQVALLMIYLSLSMS